MIKRFLLIALLVLIIAMVLYFAHQYLLASNAQEITFSLRGMYLFHFVAFFVICLSIELLNIKMPSQVGYAYLTSVFVKIGVFVLIFQSTLLKTEQLPMAEKLSIIVPMFIFLVFEAVYCGRLMNSQ